MTISYDPATGEELWRVRHEGLGWNSACRPIYENGLVHVITGFAKQLLAIRPDGTGDVTDTHLLWRARKGVPSSSSPVIAEGLLFMVADTGGVVSCLDAKNGTEIWKERLGHGASHWASPLYAVITVFKQRDRSAWSAAVARHLDEVYGFVFHLVGGDRAVAEDLNQKTWLEALDGIHPCDATRGSFRNWLFGIARRRVALDYRRRALAGNATSLSGQFEQFAELREISILPKDVLEQVEQRSVVRAAVLVLADDRRKALIWKYVEGLSVETIAIRMGRTAKAVESLLFRARAQVRGQLRGYMMPCGDGRRVAKGSSHE